jgi:hypothetical protein
MQLMIIDCKTHGEVEACVDGNRIAYCPQCRNRAAGAEAPPNGPKVILESTPYTGKPFFWEAYNKAVDGL